jgi:NAD+ synthase (glutamine-hydrolysing)/outer membrane lipoprotein carrier protein
MADSAISMLRAVPLRPILFLIGCAIAIASSASAPPAASATPSATRSGPGPQAKAPADSASANAEARNALKKAIAYHREAKDLALKFDAKIYNAALDKEDAYQGKLLLKGADKFRLEIPGGTYVSDGKDFWEYHPQNRQAVRKAAGDREGQPLPGDVLLRFLDSEPLSAATVREGGKEWLELRLDPSRAMKNLDSLAVLLDKGTAAVHRISSRDLSGNEARYTVVSIKRNSGLKDSEFAFVPPKGVETVDMRGE